MNLSHLAGGALAVSLAIAPAAADDIADGRRLALRICGVCHIVEAGQNPPPVLEPPAPAFRTLVRRPENTAARLREFLAAPHGGTAQRSMPNPELMDYQIDRIVAYLMSLQPAPKSRRR